MNRLYELHTIPSKISHLGGLGTPTPLSLYFVFIAIHLASLIEIQLNDVI